MAQPNLPPSQDQHTNGSNGNGHQDDGFRVVMEAYSDITARDPVTLEPGVPVGALGLILGEEDRGKTALMIAKAAAATRGALAGLSGPVNVALATPEDSASATIKWRLAAAGADMARVFNLAMRKDRSSRGLSLPGDTAAIAAALVAREVRMLVVDPLPSILDPRLNSWKDTDVRSALEPLVEVLDREAITTYGALHLNKGTSTDPRARAMGSGGWRILARWSFLLGLDPDDERGPEGSHRVLAHDKHNLTPRVPSRRLELKGMSVTLDGMERTTVVAEIGEEVDISASALLVSESTKAPPKHILAGAWLQGHLAHGPQGASDVMAAAAAHGFSSRTLKRAKAEIGVVSRKSDLSGGWSWELTI